MLRDRPKMRGRRGFTLVELMLAGVMLLVIMMVGAVLAAQASSVWHTVYHDTRAVHDARRALARVATELRGSSLGVITVDTGPLDADILTYQLPVGRAGGTVLWGAEETENWQVQVTLEGRRLVRLVLDDIGVSQNRQVLATGVDPALNGVKGFSVTVNGELITIRLRTRARYRGHTWRKTVTTSVWMRN